MTPLGERLVRTRNLLLDNDLNGRPSRPIAYGRVQGEEDGRTLVQWTNGSDCRCQAVPEDPADLVGATEAELLAWQAGYSVGYDTGYRDAEDW